jgi:hypothetical protein
MSNHGLKHLLFMEMDHTRTVRDEVFNEGQLFSRVWGEEWLPTTVVSVSPLWTCGVNSASTGLKKSLSVLITILWYFFQDCPFFCRKTITLIDLVCYVFPRLKAEVWIRRCLGVDVRVMWLDVGFATFFSQVSTSFCPNTCFSDASNEIFIIKIFLVSQGEVVFEIHGDCYQPIFFIVPIRLIPFFLLY